MGEEIQVLEKNQTLEQSILPTSKKILGCPWQFTIKYNIDGSIERSEARLVAKGYAQIYGIHYSETISPVTKKSTIRFLISLAVNFNWQLHQINIKNAYQNGVIDEEKHVQIPPAYNNSIGCQFQLATPPVQHSKCLPTWREIYFHIPPGHKIVQVE